MNHLSDHEIQSYSDKTSDNPEIQVHLESCPICRSHVAAYRQLFSELRKDDEPVLPNNFARMVLSRIEEKQEQKAVWRDWMLIGIAGILGVAISIYYTGSSLTGDAVTDSVKNLLQSRESVTSSFRQIQNWFGGGLSYLIFGGFLLLIFNWLDEKLIKSKRFSGQH
ncbi:hypothetical protein JNM05_06760 [bacterium]|nr:hypothetical protein [bacterium]